MPDNLLTTEQLAVHLGVSARQVQRLAATGLPSIPVGVRARRYDPLACAAWLQANREVLCPSTPRPQAAGKSLSASAVSAYTAAYRRARLRVMPSEPKQS